MTRDTFRMRRRTIPGVMALALAVGAAAAAQSAPPIHRMPAVPADLLTRSIGLRTGIGVSHDAVATSSTEAQRFYDQGLSYLHNYVWIDAARSFNQALDLDPRLTLAHVGSASRPRRSTSGPRHVPHSSGRRACRHPAHTNSNT
jgi:hypothetical protein